MEDKRNYHDIITNAFESIEKLYQETTFYNVSELLDELEPPDEIVISAQTLQDREILKAFAAMCYRHKNHSKILEHLNYDLENFMLI